MKSKDKVMKQMNKDEARKRRVRRRKRVVMAQKIGVVAGGVVLLCTVTGVVLFNMPGMKAGFFTSKAEKMAEKEQYEEAITYYKSALSYQSTNPSTYQSMARMYLQMNDYEDASAILQQGMEATGDEAVKESYITVLLNDAIEDMNSENYSWETADSVLTVLKEDASQEKAYDVLDAFYSRFVSATDESGTNELLMDGDNFDSYIRVLEELLAVYEAGPSEQLKDQLYQYAFLNSETVKLPVEQLNTYASILEKTASVLGTEDELEWIPALKKAQEVHEFFTPMLREFEAENYEVARDFIVSDEYIAIRDAFIDGEMQYWENTTYQVVSDIGVAFHLTDGKRTFSFMDEEPSEARQGFIKVWGFRWVDNGHLRTGISYVPVQENASSETYKEYEIMYWWSTAKNVALAESTYAKMNYRFETRIYSAEGMSAEVINDWGGTYEYKDTYE